MNIRSLAPFVMAGLMALSSALFADAVNIDFNNSDTDHSYSGQGAFNDPGNDYWNTPSASTNTTQTSASLTASDGRTKTLAAVTITYTGNYERSNYDNDLLRDGAVGVTSISVSGLNDNETYSIYIYSTFDSYGTQFSVGGNSVSISGSPNSSPYQLALVEGETWGVLHQLTATNGEIVVSVTKANESNYNTFITGMQIVGNIPALLPMPSETVSVDFNNENSTTYSGHGALVDAVANTYWNGVNHTVSQASNLKYSNGKDTSQIGFIFPTEGRHLRHGYSSDLLKDCRVGGTTGATESLAITGLDNERTYSLYLYSPFDAYSTDFTVGTVTKRVSGAPDSVPYQDNLVLGQTYTAFHGLRPSSGRIDVTMKAGTTTASNHTATASGFAISGFQIAAEPRITKHHLGRVIFIGDSITEASSTNPPSAGDGTWSWRYQFWKRLIDHDVPHSFVGTRTSNKNGASYYPLYKGHAFVNRHEAIWGTTAKNRAEQAPTYLQTLKNEGNTSDTAVIFVGGNDFGSTSDPEVVNLRIKSIIDQLQGDTGNNGNPDIRILVISILPRYAGSPLTTPYTNNSLYEDLNVLLKTLTHTETTASSKVTYLDLVEDFSSPPGLLYDGTHPNLAGEIIIGDSVYEALVPDSDNDGLYDTWELAYYADLETASMDTDTDGDGISTVEEFHLGTSPTAHNQRQTYITFSADNTQLSFTLPSTSGTGYSGFSRHYRLESSADFDTWTPEKEGVADGTPVHFDIPSESVNRFYRLVINVQ